MSEEKQEVVLAPRIVRIIAGFDYVLMFFLALIGASIALSSLAINDILAFIQVSDLLTYQQILFTLQQAGLTVGQVFLFLFTIGITLWGVALVGMVVALGTAYKKAWAIPLGVTVSALAIFGGITSYFFRIVAPVENIGPLVILNVALDLFFGVLAINVFFVGAFLIWQLEEQPKMNIRIGRFVLIWNIDTLSLFLTALFVPGIIIFSDDLVTALGVAYIVVAVIGIINVIVRPLFTKIIAQIARWWLGFAISFILMFIINTIILFFLPLVLPGFIVLGLPTAFLGSFILSGINAIIVNIVGLDDDSSFFNKLIAQQLIEEAEEKGVPQTPALVAIEIDGLSHTVIQEALKRGYMPVTKSLLAQPSHNLTGWDCGVPSMTSSCQAGIMYGNNHDIPAFRWYVKPEERLLVSNHPSDAREIDQRASSGQGILRNGGSSVSNLISGDASYSFFTMSTLTKEDAKAGRRRSKDLYYYLLNPWAMNRSIIYTIWDILVEIGQIIKQTITRRKPRMNRLAHAYPVIRAATNIFMRDVATAMVIQDILRGVPAIYVTYLGYDEIAHHSGPMTSDALKSLRGLDKQIRRILHAIEHYAPRPYHLFLLSDHGQSIGWTFKQRYKKSLKDFISELLAGKASVGEMEALDAHRGYVAGLVDDLNEGQAAVEGEKAPNRTIKYFHRQASKKAEVPPQEQVKAEDVIVCPSGNLAQVYFTFQRERATLQDLEAKFPGFVSKLVSLEGVGFAIVMDNVRGPMLLGKEGAVELRTGIVDGKNPLIPYGREEIRIKQMLRLAEYPSSGAIILISPVYPDGSVAAYEELIGSHGGLGGLQTEAFLVYPAKFEVDGESIINSDQIYGILNQARSD